jgi:beta-galactosidase
MAVITKVKELSESWCYCKGENAGDEITLLSKQDSYNAVINFGSYNNPEQPQEGIYKKRIILQADNDALVLEMKDFNSYGKVYVDGVFVKEVQPYNSTVTLDEFSDRTEIELAIFLSQKTIQESPELKIFLYEGTHAKDIKCCGADEKKLSDFVGQIFYENNHELAKAKINHLKLIPGEITVLHGDFHADEKEKQGLKLSIIGRDAKVLVLLNGKMLGRLWLPSEFTQPEFRGGDPTVLYLPESFMKEENQIDLLIEAMQGNPEIDQLEYTPAVSV